MSNTSTDLSQFIQKQADYVFQPEKWAYDLLKYEMDAWQSAAARGFIEKRYCAWSAGSGVGKSSLLAVLILFFLSTRPFPKIPCTAPSQHQLYDVLWAEISKWLRRSELLSKLFTWTQTKVSLKDHGEEWFAIARTSRPRPGETSTEGLQGFHAEHIMFVVDEASGVPDQIVGAVDGALTTPGAHIVLASNPTRRAGYFFNTITDPRIRDIWDVHTINAEKAKYVTPGSVERIARIYGKDSDYYRIKVLGLPPTAEGAALISPEQMFAAHVRIISDEDIEKDGEIVISCDPARFGDDYTVIYVRKGLRFIERHQQKGMDTEQIQKILMDLFDLHRPPSDEEVRRRLKMPIDEIGIGAGIVDGMKKKLTSTFRSIVKPIHVGKDALNKEKFYNLRAEIGWNLRKAIDYVSLPFDTEHLDEECTTIVYKWDPKDTKIKIESKDDVRSRLGRSPGDFDSFCLSLSTRVIKGTLTSEHYFRIGIGQHNVDNKPVTSKVLTLEDVGKNRWSGGFVGVKRYASLERKDFFDRASMGKLIH